MYWLSTVPNQPALQTNTNVFVVETVEKFAVRMLLMPSVFGTSNKLMVAKGGAAEIPSLSQFDSQRSQNIKSSSISSD